MNASLSKQLSPYVLKFCKVSHNHHLEPGVLRPPKKAWFQLVSMNGTVVNSSLYVNSGHLHTHVTSPRKYVGETLINMAVEILTHTPLHSTFLFSQTWESTKQYFCHQMIEKCFSHSAAHFVNLIDVPVSAYRTFPSQTDQVSG
jgi:hypothetical protein